MQRATQGKRFGVVRSILLGVNSDSYMSYCMRTGSYEGFWVEGKVHNEDLRRVIDRLMNELLPHNIKFLARATRDRRESMIDIQALKAESSITNVHALLDDVVQWYANRPKLLNKFDDQI